MIDKFEVLQAAKRLGLQNSTIEKDYVLGWVLMSIQNHSKIRNSWIFKGGTCLKKCFFDDYRFSEDLDFTLLDPDQMDEHFLMGVLHDLAEWVYEEIGIEIPPKNLSVEFYTNLQGSSSAQAKLSYIGPLKQKKVNSLPTIKLDLTPHEKVVLIPEHRGIFHSYSDRPSSPKAFCYGYEKFLLKSCALLRKGQDLVISTISFTSISSVTGLKRSPNFLSLLSKNALLRKCLCQAWRQLNDILKRQSYPQNGKICFGISCRH